VRPSTSRLAHSRRSWARAGVSAGLASGVLQVAPLATSMPLLRRLWPALAGYGRADHVALTFDDGPDAASTPRFLEVLARYGVRATFFLLGEMVQRFPDLPQQMADAGHELAVHSWDHRNHLRHSPAQTVGQLARTVELLERRTGTRPTLFRPPYGTLTGAGLRAARSVGLTPVLWTAWGRDWTAQADAASVLAEVTSGDVAGGTVLLHDSDCTSAPGAWHAAHQALPGLLDWCSQRDLTVGTLAEHGLRR